MSNSTDTDIINSNIRSTASRSSQKKSVNNNNNLLSIKNFTARTLRRSKQLFRPTSTQHKSINPRFKSLPPLTEQSSSASSPLNSSKVMMSTKLSRRSDNNQDSQQFDLTPDQQVAIALNAKKKAHDAQRQQQQQGDANSPEKQRKVGEMLFGPSVAMLAHHNAKTQSRGSKTNKNKKDNRLFRKFLPKNLVASNRAAGNKPAPVKNPEEVRTILQSMSHLVLFSKLSPSLLEQIAQAMVLKNFPPDEVICKQGDFGDELYVVKSGELLVTKDYDDKDPKKSAAKKKSNRSSASSVELDNSRQRSMSNLSRASVVESHTMKTGDCFGELGMHYGSPRERTVSTLTPCQLYVLSRSDYSKIVENEYMRRNELMLEALNKVKVLEDLHPEQLKTLVQFVELVSFKKGQKIIEKGSMAGTFYMIVSGSVDCIVYERDVTKRSDEMASASSVGEDDEDEVESPLKKKVYPYGPGEYFGERGLLQNDFVRKADVIAQSDVELLAITYSTFTEHLSGLTEAFEENIRRQAVEDAPFFDHLSADANAELQYALSVKTFSDGEYIIKENSNNDKFYIITKGEVLVKHSLDRGNDVDFEITTLRERNYFGEGSVLSADRKANASIIAKGSVKCYSLDRENFNKFVPKEKMELLKETFNERNRRTQMRTREKQNEVLANVELKDLKVMTNLGSGCFGLVKLVEVKSLKQYYALKVLEKGTVVRNNQEINVMNEKKILLDSEHPFIVKLYRTFKDKKYLYFLMEFLQGGELFQYLHNECHGHFDNQTAKFYVSCVVDGLEYLHRKHIVYRDLKPENLMIDIDGYGRIVDFGFAKKLVFRTWTLCGTAQYLAPEILLNGGYTRSVDFWTLGILIYELFTGTTPFKRAKRDDLFHAIKYENRIKFHSRRWKGADDAKDLVCLLLHKHPRKRLGCQGTRARGFKDVKEHRWFGDVDFEKLYYKEIAPPWIPKVNGGNDVSNFEEYDEEESPLQGKYDDRAGDSEVWKDF